MEPEDLRARAVALEHLGQSLDRRVTTLETWQRQQDINDAKLSERWEHISDRFNRLEVKIGDINDILSRIMWIVVTAILVAVIGFALKGGFM